MLLESFLSCAASSAAAAMLWWMVVGVNVRESRKLVQINEFSLKFIAALCSATLSREYQRKIGVLLSSNPDYPCVNSLSLFLTFIIILFITSNSRLLP